MTATISGLSIFVNSYGVRSVTSPVVYTTAKNLVATVVLGVVALAAWRLRRPTATTAITSFVKVTRARGESQSGSVKPAHRAWGRWLGLAYVGVVGGGVAFVLFFQGLTRTGPAPAAFWRDTMVLWVALLAVSILRERVRGWNVLAFALLIAGQVVLSGGVGHLAANRGETLVLASTVLWAGEVVIAKSLLVDLAPARLALVRMGLGSLSLTAYLAVTGALGGLATLSAVQWGWVLLTGLLLGAYVATWMTALARARALDVTSILVASALITWLLQVAVGTTTVATSSIGLVLIALGAGVVVHASLENRHSSAPAVDGP